MSEFTTKEIKEMTRQKDPQAPPITQEQRTVLLSMPLTDPERYKKFEYLVQATDEYASEKLRGFTEAMKVKLREYRENAKTTQAKIPKLKGKAKQKAREDLKMYKTFACKLDALDFEDLQIRAKEPPREGDPNFLGSLRGIYKEAQEEFIQSIEKSARAPLEKKKQEEREKEMLDGLSDEAKALNAYCLGQRTR